MTAAIAHFRQGAAPCAGLGNAVHKFGTGDRKDCDQIAASYFERAIELEPSERLDFIVSEATPAYFTQTLGRSIEEAI